MLRRPDQHSVKTDVSEPTQNPMWNATLEFSNVPGEDLMERSIEVTLWDYCPDKEPIFLGSITKVNLRFTLGRCLLVFACRGVFGRFTKGIPRRSARVVPTGGPEAAEAGGKVPVRVP